MELLLAVTRFGVFVELDDLFVEGLVHINSLGQDYFHYDQAQQRLIGERTQAAYHLGDYLQVIVARVDLDELVDLELANSKAPRRDRSMKKSASKKSTANKRSKSKKTSAKANTKKTTGGSAAKRNSASNSRSATEQPVKTQAKGKGKGKSKGKVKAMPNKKTKRKSKKKA